MDENELDEMKARLDAYARLLRAYFAARKRMDMDERAVAEVLDRMKTSHLYEILEDGTGQPYTWKSWCEEGIGLSLKEAERRLAGKTKLEECVVRSLEGTDRTRGEACRMLWEHIDNVTSGGLAAELATKR